MKGIFSVLKNNPNPFKKEGVMKKYFFLSVVVVLALAVGYCHADIPGKINYQGKLTNAQGQLIDGQYNMVFTLFDAASGGTQKWTETHNSVQVTNGLFNVMLGSTTNSLTPVFQGNDSLYLEIGIGGETLSPRQEMASAGYALNVAGAAKVPIGGIIMWSGSVASIPANWALCDGGTYNGYLTPNLRDRFIVGAGNTYNPGNTGGANSVTLTIAQMPSHTHIQDEHSHIQNTGAWSAYGTRMVTTNTGPSGQYTTGLTTATNQNTGGDQAHENRPPYYALCFIMRVS